MEKDPRLRRYHPLLARIVLKTLRIRRKREFGHVSPLAFRYVHSELAPYTSEAAKLDYMGIVESAISIALNKRKRCSLRAVRLIVAGVLRLVPREVYVQEYGKKRRIKGTKHDVRALVVQIMKHIPEWVWRYLHEFATSCDIIDNANIARIRDVMLDQVIPILEDVERQFIRLSIEYAHVVCPGRTHLQHASPVTFGFLFAVYAERLGEQIRLLKRDIAALKGKFNGPVGTHGPASLFLRDPRAFERDVLACISLKPARCSTQILIPDPLVDVIHRLCVIMSIFGNLGDDMRRLHSTEVGEIIAELEKGQTGSSIMAAKVNPITWEQAKSLFKEMIPRMITRYLDLISEHQRDLTNSASSRFILEMVELLYTVAKSLRRELPKVKPDTHRMTSNLDMTHGQIISDPLVTMLLVLGHPNAHTYVKRLAQKSRRTGRRLFELFAHDPSVAKYGRMLTRRQVAILSDPSLYVGEAPRTAIRVARYWERRLKLAA
ncbi:MAG: lyase family protein [Parcubacteria group bacterium]